MGASWSRSESWQHSVTKDEVKSAVRGFEAWQKAQEELAAAGAVQRSAPSTGTLLDRVGGANTVRKVVEVFCRKMYEDERLLPYLKHTDMVKLRAKQSGFLTFLFSPTDQANTSRHLRTAHLRLIKRQGFNPEHFDLGLSYMQEAMREIGVVESVIREAMAKIKPFKEVTFTALPRDAEDERRWVVEERLQRLQQEQEELRAQQQEQQQQQEAQGLLEAQGSQNSLGSQTTQERAQAQSSSPQVEIDAGAQAARRQVLGSKAGTPPQLEIFTLAGEPAVEGPSQDGGGGAAADDEWAQGWGRAWDPSPSQNHSPSQSHSPSQGQGQGRGRQGSASQQHTPGSVSTPTTSFKSSRTSPREPPIGPNGSGAAAATDCFVAPGPPAAGGAAPPPPAPPPPAPPLLPGGLGLLAYHPAAAAAAVSAPAAAPGDVSPPPPPLPLPPPLALTRPRDSPAAAAVAGSSGKPPLYPIMSSAPGTPASPATAGAFAAASGAVVGGHSSGGRPGVPGVMLATSTPTFREPTNPFTSSVRLSRPDVSASDLPTEVATAAAAPLGRVAHGPSPPKSMPLPPPPPLQAAPPMRRVSSPPMSSSTTDGGVGMPGSPAAPVRPMMSPPLAARSSASMSSFPLPPPSFLPPSSPMDRLPPLPVPPPLPAPRSSPPCPSPSGTVTPGSTAADTGAAGAGTVSGGIVFGGGGTAKGAGSITARASGGVSGMTSSGPASVTGGSSGSTSRQRSYTSSVAGEAAVLSAPLAPLAGAVPVSPVRAAVNSPRVPVMVLPRGSSILPGPAAAAAAAVAAAAGRGGSGHHSPPTPVVTRTGPGAAGVRRMSYAAPETPTRSSVDMPRGPPV